MPFLRKYAVLTVTGTTAIRIPIIKRAVVDFAVSADWTPAAGDVKIAIDGTAPANVANLPTAVASGNGAFWEFILTAAELTCKQCVVTVVDSATKAIEDQSFGVETFGNASAMYQADLSAANLPANATQLAGQTITAGAGVTFPSSVASPTNLTAGTITTVTNLTNAPGAGDLTATMKASVTTAATAATPIAASVSGAVGSVTGNVGGNVVGTVASVVGNVGGNIVGTVASVVGNVGGNVVGTVASVVGAVGSIVNAGIDLIFDRAAGVETNYTLRQALRLILAACSGKLSGAATATVLVRDVNDTKNRISATVDASGNRSAVTTDVS